MKINLILAYYTFQTMCVVPCSKLSNMTTEGKILIFHSGASRPFPFSPPLYYYYVLLVILNMHHVCGSLNM